MALTSKQIDSILDEHCDDTVVENKHEDAVRVVKQSLVNNEYSIKHVLDETGLTKKQLNTFLLYIK